MDEHDNIDFLFGSVFPSYLNFWAYFNFWLNVRGTGMFNIKYYQLIGKIVVITGNQ